MSVAVTAGCGADSRTSELLDGLDMVYASIQADPGPSVVAMTMLVKDGPAGEIVAAQIQRIIDAGAVVVSAAGDASDDACLYVPANMDGVITVSAANMTAHRSGFPWEGANYGRCVNAWAPGARVTAASATPNVTATFSGTAQAMALVTGIVAQLLERAPDAGQAKDAFLRTSDNAVMAWTTPETVRFFAQTPYQGTCSCSE